MTEAPPRITILEIMIVVAIVSILTAVVLPLLVSRQEDPGTMSTSAAEQQSQEFGGGVVDPHK